ncbi:hypothetical protein TNCV_3390931 [Trichonephila clavipes]|nr:hypothetical protein TNCV_3390931 [Trichonephila clavipes]
MSTKQQNERLNETPKETAQLNDSLNVGNGKLWTRLPLHGVPGLFRQTYWEDSDLERNPWLATFSFCAKLRSLEERDLHSRNRLSCYLLLGIPYRAYLLTKDLSKFSQKEF